MIRKIKALAAVVGVFAAGAAFWLAIITLLCIADAAGIQL